MRSPVPAIVAGLFGALAAAQSPSFDRWIEKRYGDSQRVTVQTVLQDARAERVATPAQSGALKRALRRAQGKERRALPAWKRIDFSPARPPGQTLGSMVGTDTLAEAEFNGAWQYADIMTGNVASGSCAATNDVDCWQFTSTGAYHTVTVQAAGATPVTDSILTIRNDKGDPLAFDDNGLGLLSRVHLYLPAGTYYAEVASFYGTNGGGYDLVVQTDPVDVVALGPGGASGTTQTAGAGAQHEVFEVSVAEGNVRIGVHSSGSDTVLTVQRDDGLILFADDDSSTGLLDAAADLDLPAGNYFVHVDEISGQAGVAFNVSLAVTPGALVDLAASGSASGHLLGDESMRIARVNLASAQRLDLVTTAGSPTPVGDTVLTLLDPTLDRLCDVDDDHPFSPSRGGYSRIDVDLPAAAYLVAVTPFPGLHGNYALSATLGPYAPTGTLEFGRPGAHQIAGFGRVNSYTFDNCSMSSTKMLGNDYWFALMDGHGELASCQNGAPGYPQGAEVPDGTNTLLVYDRYDYTGPLATNLVPALSYNGVSVVTHAKQGDIVVQMAEFGIVPGPPFQFGVGERGFLCLPLGPLLVTMDLQFVPASGVNTWWTPSPIPYQVMIQTGDMHTGNNWPVPALATLRNLIKL